MTQAEDIKLILIEMLALLKLSNAKEWEKTIQKLSYEILDIPNETKREILSLYGGMGSLNDLILHKDGYPLKKENDEFDSLKTQLYDLCREDLIVGKGKE
ncbi:Uncharacterized protein MCB1EB_0712 [Mycoavidus cysteinexigens]|uniref:DUF6966 domain-containing protein n=1 Tax=Mycoavidus cysteinexigens TaxID=1553431 RepID=A0A2Z6ETV4_9BURK|nr:hypothetical protein [Mycoavidus cysteinexigens]BBE08873.1 Uncharacterized protein MCB1EB_0712 [Mycoavidus cysteinexigens]GAM52406.1 hypothetical protein EBME_0869 [bacterium endosymbiont of Mortierella elongata FMR23-6]GLR02192.1 hypothetical protein GCM10007934_20070 [Mycoavidus cysteinexigens]